MSDLSDIYQEVILDHNKAPRNFGPLENQNRSAEGYNPLCGDRLRLDVAMQDDVISEVRFEASGCAISTASASIMTEAVQGMSIEEAEALFEKFHRMVVRDGAVSEGGPALGKLEAFAGVGRFPARVKCATLAWHTLKSALADSADVVTTELAGDAYGLGADGGSTHA